VLSPIWFRQLTSEPVDPERAGKAKGFLGLFSSEQWNSETDTEELFLRR
jgi:hypothetical protein